LAGLLATTLLASCGGTGSRATTSSSRARATTGTTTTTSAPAPTTTTVPAPTSTTAGVTTCQPSQLRIAQSGFQGAAGTIEVTFSLVNTSSAPCTMHGYPGMLLLGAGGAPLPTAVVRGGGLAFEDLPVGDVALSPGQAAYFNVGYSDVTTDATTCSIAAQVAITPPGATSHAVVAVSPDVNACNGGTLDVSPVFAATDAAATMTTAPAP